jgi:hypothetical protein
MLTSTVSPVKYLSLVKVKTSSVRSPKDDLWVRDAKYNTGTTNCLTKKIVISKNYLHQHTLWFYRLW